MKNRNFPFRQPFTVILSLFFATSFSGIAQSIPVKTNTGQDLQRLQPKLQEALDALRAKVGVPGATLGIAFADGQTLALATGVSDLATKNPMKPSDRMPMGSVGKTFVAAVALQLVHEGRFALDDKIEKYLGREPWFNRLPNAKDITIRMLMRHTSGLVRYEFNPKFLEDMTRQPDKIWRPEEQLSYLFDTKAAFAAGQGWDYSDTNYIVLGMIIEQVTGSTYVAELQKRLLAPLKLHEILPQDSRRLPGLVQGYAGLPNPFGGSDAMIKDGQLAFNPQFEWTGGGVFGTSVELARWAQLLYGGRAFDKALLPVMLDGVTAPLGPNVKYGLGVIIRSTPFGPGWGHSGFFPGYLTEMIYFPELKAAIAVQINSSVPRKTGNPLTGFIIDLARIIKAETQR